MIKSFREILSETYLKCELGEILTEQTRTTSTDIAMYAVKAWLEQWRSDPNGILTVDEVGQTQLEFLDELEGKLTISGK
jgi:hypothetical protein